MTLLPFLCSSSKHICHKCAACSTCTPVFLASHYVSAEGQRQTPLLSKKRQEKKNIVFRVRSRHFFSLFSDAVLTGVSGMNTTYFQGREKKTRHKSRAVFQVKLWAKEAWKVASKAVMQDDTELCSDPGKVTQIVRLWVNSQHWYMIHTKKIPLLIH